MGGPTKAYVGTATLVAALALGASAASGAKVENGNFERGNLSGWQTTYYPHPDVPGGEWFVYGDIMRPDARRGGDVPPPPQGQFGALTDQGTASAQILSQAVDLAPGKRHKLRFKLAYSNQNTLNRPTHRRGDLSGFITPRTLRLNRTNQQFRMDVMKPGAPIKSVKGKHVLESVYRTDRGDPNVRGFRTIRANLTPYAGKKVRLRFAVVATEAPLNAAIDAVKIKTKND
jgi:hypothetical protein